MGRRKTNRKPAYAPKPDAKKKVESKVKEVPQPATPSVHSKKDDKSEALKTVKALLKGKKKGERGYDRLMARKKKLEMEL